MSNKKEHSSFKDLFTRDIANQGRKMPVKTIDGKETDDWLLVAGSESDIWEGIKADYSRRLLAAEEGDITEVSLAPMVIGWSYREECTTDNVQELLNNAPYILDAIDLFSKNEANLVKKD